MCPIVRIIRRLVEGGRIMNPRWIRCVLSLRYTNIHKRNFAHVFGISSAAGI